MESPSIMNLTGENMTSLGNLSYVMTPTLFTDIVIALNMWGLPALITIGIMGNFLSLVVFLTTRCRQQSSSVYLAFLNVADSLFLLCIGVIWLGWMDYDVMSWNGVCQLTVYFSYVSGFLSVWTVVGFTVERFIVVYFPFRRVVYCTRQRAMVVICCLATGCLLLYSFALWTAGPWDVFGEKKCSTFPKYESLVRMLSTIDTFITLVLPSLVIIVLNILIARKLWDFRFRRVQEPEVGSWRGRMSQGRMGSVYQTSRDTHSLTQARCNGQRPNVVFVRSSLHEVSVSDGCQWQKGLRHDLMNSTGQEPTQSQRFLKSNLFPKCIRCPDFTPRRQTSRDIDRSYSESGEDASLTTNAGCSTGPGHLRRHSQRPPGDQMRTTRTLLVISSVFLVLNLPSHAFRVWVTVAHLIDSSVVFSQSALLWQLVFQFLYYSNFSCNFFMYCACSRMFRTGLRSLLRTLRLKVKLCRTT